MLAEEYISKIIKDYKSHNELSIFLNKYYDWKKSYNVHQRWNVYEAGVKFLEKIGENELAYYEWKQLQIEEYGQSDQFTYRRQAVLRLSFFEKSLNKGLVDSFHIHKIAFKGHQLTKFGLRNKVQIFNTLDIHIKSKYNFSFFEEFWVDYENPNCDFKTFKFEHYLDIFKDSDKEYDLWNRRLSDPKIRSKYVRKDLCAKDELVFASIIHRAFELLREAENLYRSIIGAKKVGESWISETELYYLIKTSLTDYKVIHHGQPKFLGRQHLDIWIPELKVGIEYQGAQHDKPVEFFGGKKAFDENIKRDERKRQLCKENGVILIEVREEYNIEDLMLLITNAT